MKVVELELRVADCELRVVDCELRVASCELRVASCELRVASCELRVASCELRVASCELRVASCKLRVATTTIQSPHALCELRNGGWGVGKDEGRIDSHERKSCSIRLQSIAIGIPVSPRTFLNNVVLDAVESRNFCRARCEAVIIHQNYISVKCFHELFFQLRNMKKMPI